MSSDTPDLRLLLPTVELLGPDPAEERLAALYALPPGRHVRVNMVASVDGAAWGDDGVSGSVNDAADWRVFRVLRALADVVLVGAGTARAEGYTPLSRPAGLEHLAPAGLELALVTRSGRVPDALRAGERRTWVLTGRAGAERAADAVGAEHVLVCPDAAGGVDLSAGLASLAEHGLRRVLCEGGPGLLGAMLAADLVDELCTTTTPQVVGTGPGRIVAADGTTPGTARGAHLSHLLAAPSGTLLTRWTLRPALG